MKPLIGIPVHNDKEAFEAMIDSLITSTDHYERVILIESESTDGCGEYCDWLKGHERWRGNTKIEVIHTKKEGPLKALNKLFEIAKKEKRDLFLTQTDVIFPKLYKRDWLEHMSKIAESEVCGMVTCLNGGGVSGPSYLDGLQWVGAWCTYIPFRTIDKLGGYDGNYPNGWGVDIDYSYAVYKAGLGLFKTEYWVDHHMMNDRVHDKDEKGKQEAAKYFKKKWQI